MNTSQSLSAFALLLVATTLEVSGDAIVRLAIYDHAGVIRAPLMLVGAIFLLGYGTSLNLAPVEFRHVVGLYIAMLFVGGALIVIGGLLVTFWKPGYSP
jgi:hypothetical protein